MSKWMCKAGAIVTLILLALSYYFEIKGHMIWACLSVAVGLVISVISAKRYKKIKRELEN